MVCEFLDNLVLPVFAALMNVLQSSGLKWKNLCTSLQVLTLSACKYLDETALDALHSGKKLPELQTLDISYGSLGRTAIEGVLAHCPHLIKISLSGCAHVTDHLWTHLSSTSAHTQVVDAEVDVTTPGAAVGHCNTVIQPYLEQKVWSSEGDFNASNKLDDGVEEVTKMEDMEVHVPSRALQKLLCVGCQNVRSVFIPSHACLHLSDINLSLSNNIREVYLECINLTHLNLRYSLLLFLALLSRSFTMVFHITRNTFDGLE